MRLSLVLAFLFFIGSCFGWVLELLYRNLTHRHKKWINPGFCTGPYLPIYGFGLCTLFLLASLEDLHLIADPVWNRVALFLAMAVAMTLIEYIAGLACLKYLKVRLTIQTFGAIFRGSSARCSPSSGRRLARRTIFWCIPIS